MKDISKLYKDGVKDPEISQKSDSLKVRRCTKERASSKARKNKAQNLPLGCPGKDMSPCWGQCFWSDGWEGRVQGGERLNENEKVGQVEMRRGSS